MACSPTLAPLAALTGAVDAVLPADPLRPLRGAPLGAVCVNLHGRGPESHRILLEAEPSELLAFEHLEVPASRGMPRWRQDEHEVVRWCRMLEGLGLAADPSELDLPAPVVEPPADARGATLLHPGAASGARRWPAERWAAVARAEARDGRPVLVTGSRGERGLARRVAGEAGLDPGAVLAGRTDLLGLAALVAGAERLVCGDTGVAHLATAFGTPSVVLFGPTSPDRWGPPSERPQHVALWAGREGDPHREEVDPGLLRIEVAEVLETLRGSTAAPSSPAVRTA